MQTSPRMVGWDIRSRVLGSAKTCEKKKAGILRVQGRGLYKSSNDCYKNTALRRGCLPNRVPSSSHPPARMMTDPKQPSSQAAGNPMGQSIPFNPVHVAPPTPDTLPQTLALEDEGDKCLETSTSGLRRVVEKTVDRLGRSRSFSSKSPSKRIFSLGRNRGKEPGPSGAITTPLPPPILTSR